MKKNKEEEVEYCIHQWLIKLNLRKAWINPNISYKNFKVIWRKFPDEGPTPQHIDKIIWHMLKERKINVFISQKDICITPQQIPKNPNMIIG